MLEKKSRHFLKEGASLTQCDCLVAIVVVVIFFVPAFVLAVVFVPATVVAIAVAIAVMVPVMVVLDAPVRTFPVATVVVAPFIVWNDPVWPKNSNRFKWCSLRLHLFFSNCALQSSEGAYNLAFTKLHIRWGRIQVVLTMIPSFRVHVFPRIPARIGKAYYAHWLPHTRHSEP